MKKGRYILLLLLFCSLHVWGQQLYFSMQYRKPAAIRIAPDVKTAMVVNSVSLTEPVKNCLFAMTQTLEQLERFEEVSVLPQAVASTSAVNVRSSLSPSRADSLCNLYGVDALLVLNALLILDTDGTELMEDGTWDAWREAYLTAQWSIHYPTASAKLSTLSFTTTDTLVWEANNASRMAAFAALPDKSTVMNEIAAYEGEQMANRITPQWVTDERYLYKNRDEAILAGLQAFSRQQWTAAIAAWETAAGSDDKQTAAYAAANIALAMEMQDRFEEALVWAKKAVATFRRISTPDAAQQVVNMEFYQRQLLLRKNYTF